MSAATATHVLTASDVHSGALYGTVVLHGTESECVEYLTQLAELYGVEPMAGGHVLHYGAMTYLVSLREKEMHR